MLRRSFASLRTTRFIVTETATYTPEEERGIKERFTASGAVTCPRDGAAMTERDIGGGSFGLGYA